MKFTLVRSAIKELQASRQPVPANGQTTVTNRTEHGFATGIVTGSDQGIAVINTTFKIEGRGQNKEVFFDVRIVHECLLHTALIMEDRHVADANIMGPLMHAATGLAHTAATQMLHSMGIFVPLSYPDFKVTFAPDLANPQPQEQITL